MGPHAPTHTTTHASVSLHIKPTSHSTSNKTQPRNNLFEPWFKKNNARVMCHIVSTSCLSHSSLHSNGDSVSLPHVISFYEIISNQTLNQIVCHVTLKRIVTHMATCQVTIYPLKNSNLTFNLTFLNLDFIAFCPILAFKCYFGAQLTEWWLLGCFCWPSHG